jgi:hypothetical protein
MAGLVPPVRAAFGDAVPAAVAAARPGSSAPPAAPAGRASVRFLLTPTILRDPTVRFFWDRQLAEFRPDVIVLFLGIWEAGEIARSGGSLADAEWRGRYERDVIDPWVRLLTAGGARLVWIGNPVVGTPEATVALAQLDEVVRGLPARWPLVRPVAAGPALNGPGDAYQDVLVDDGVPVRTRQLDGLHLCAGGAARLTDLVLAALDPWPAPVAGWRQGPWRADPAYPADGCPPVAG